MNEKKPMVERRKYRRFRPREGAVVVFGVNSKKVGVGPIADISLGGLAFHYVSDEQRPVQTNDLNIFLPEDCFHLKKIPYQTVSDQEGRNVPHCSIRVRRRGVRFGTLDETQSSELERFIEMHSTP